MVWLSKVPTCFNFNIWNDFYIVYFSLYDFACYTFFSQDFESERKWKLAQAKKVALKASKEGMLDPATRGEKKMKVLISLL